MFEKGDKDWSNSLNAQLLYEGLASLRDLEQEGGDIPDEVNDWYKIEEDAKEQQLKIWEYGGAVDSDVE